MSGGRILYAINKRGSDDVAFSAVVTEVEAAVSAWRGANLSVVDFTRIADPSGSSVLEGTRASRNDRINVVLWDEDPDNKSMVPPRTFSATIRQIDAASGDITDADIVLNASQFRWAAKSDPSFTTLTGPVDIRSTLTHALGLFIGLNVVPTQGSVMHDVDYPGDTARRALTNDEFAAALDVYPPTPGPAVTSISGQVTRSGQPVFGAYAVAYQNGIPFVGGITDKTGAYSIRRVPAGTYTVRVLTVKRPLTSPFFSTLDNNFLSQSYLGLAVDPGTSVVAVPGSDTPGVNFAVASATTADPWEPDDDDTNAKMIVPNGPRQIHHSFPAGDLDIVKFTAVAGHIYSVETSNLGSGLSDSDTSITVVGPGIVRANNDRNRLGKSRTSRVVFQASAGGDHFVQIVQADSLIAGSGTAYDISVADLAFLVPTASSVSPTSGSVSGGYQVTVNGANLVPGAAVAFGANAAMDVDVLGPSQLLATVPPGAAPGAVAVTVTNPGGAASPPLAGGFTYIADVLAGFSVTNATALPTVPGDSDAVAWVDYDNDGDLDLYFTNTLSNMLFSNNGNETFTNVSAASGIQAGSSNNPESAAWGDYNNDGCIDMYMVNLQVTTNKILLMNNCNNTFTNVTSTAGVAGRVNGRSNDAAWGDYNNDGFLDLFVAYDDQVGPNQLFRNNKNGMFTDVAAAAGVNNTGSGINVNWGDYDRDGWPDIFLVRSGAQTDILYHNNTNGTFTDVTAGSGITNVAQGRDAVWGDFSGDGYLDLYVVGTTGLNRLFLNSGSTPFTFSDISASSGTADTLGSPRAVAVSDFDNDGRLDIFVAQAFDGRTDSQVDFLFHNEGGDPPTFLDYTFFAGVNDGFNGLSACFGDYTGGGTADLFVGNAGISNDVLFKNLANQNNWLVVKLVGTLSNRQGVGARVSVAADLDGNAATADVTQTREMIGGSRSQNAVQAAFGLGRTAVERREVSTLSVAWPASGRVQTFSNIAVDQVITVFEGTPTLTVTSVTPSSGPALTGTTVVVSGENFAADATVTFGGVMAAVITRTGSNSITVTTPSLPVGPVDVTVTNPSRPVGDPLREGTLVNGYLYFGDTQQSLYVFDRVNTTLIWGTVPGQPSYDVIRGNLSSMSQSGGQVNLGTVICLENDSPDTTTGPNNVDQGVPAVGQGFFYLVRFSGSYGTSSSGSVRVASSGDCP